MATVIPRISGRVPRNTVDQERRLARDVGSTGTEEGLLVVKTSKQFVDLSRIGLTCCLSLLQRGFDELHVLEAEVELGVWLRHKWLLSDAVCYVSDEIAR